jgi:hypothetical protein
VDPFAIEISDGDVATVVFAVGDALGDALVRPGRVVMRLEDGVEGCGEVRSAGRGSGT